MSKAFATTVIFDESRSRVLLMLREDFRLWALPGGHIEPGETPEQAAVRETLEETGYDVALDRYVGVYRRPQLDDQRHVYTAHITGGQPIRNGPETVEVRWYSLDALPRRVTPYLVEIVQDSVSESGQPIEHIQELSGWNIFVIRLMVALRDLRNRMTGRK